MEHLNSSPALGRIEKNRASMGRRQSSPSSDVVGRLINVPWWDVPMISRQFCRGAVCEPDSFGGWILEAVKKNLESCTLLPSPG